MAVIDEPDHAMHHEIHQSLENAANKLFGDPGPAVKTILLLVRDTGSGKQMGVYPELDSGLAIHQIIQAIHAIPDFINDKAKAPEPSQMKLRVVLCGNPTEVPGVHGIGEYWKEFQTEKGAPKWPKETKRDIEAIFIKKAYEKGHFHLAVGFRSGVVDLFTFLGIPTVSIGLRKLIGETRHKRLAKAAARRWNIQYEQPRQAATRWFTDPFGARNLGSPYWMQAGSKADAPSLAEKVHLQCQEPGPFAPFDNYVVSTGLWIAIRDALGWKTAAYVAGQGSRGVTVFHASQARSCYVSSHFEGIRGKKLVALEAYYREQIKLEEGDFLVRHSRLGELGELEGEFGKVKEKMRREWAGLLENCKAPPPKQSAVVKTTVAK